MIKSICVLFLIFKENVVIILLLKWCLKLSVLMDIFFLVVGGGLKMFFFINKIFYFNYELVMKLWIFKNKFKKINNLKEKWIKDMNR